MAHLVIVDDDADLRDLLGTILQAHGHAVREAQNGQEGLELVADQTPDLLLVDVEMPVLDGPGMAYGLLFRDWGDENIPIVLLSGMVGLPQLADSLGTPYFLAKPYSLDALVRLVNRALHERVPPRPRLEAS
jgi:CheY-like chemotaxis protein